jgi:hypothetical protein
MPTLIKNITGDILDNFTGDVKLSKSVMGQFGQEGYIEMGGFVAFLQNFRKIPKSESIVTPPNFGLNNKTDFITIEISY